MGLTETLKMQMQEQSPVQPTSPETSPEVSQMLRFQNSELQSANQSLLSEMENAARQIIDLTGKLESAAQTIQMLQSQSSELMSENQNLLLQMMTASEQIESLTSRAASVDMIEQENQKLREEAESSRIAADRAETTTKAAIKRFEAEKARRKEVEYLREDDYMKWLRSQESTRKTERQMAGLQTKYRRVIIGIVILAVTVAVLTAFNYRSILAECVQWIADH